MEQRRKIVLDAKTKLLNINKLGLGKEMYEDVINEVIEQALTLTLTSIESNIFKTWYETQGYVTTLNSKLLEKDGLEYDIDNLFKHYCNLLEFGN